MRDIRAAETLLDFAPVLVFDVLPPEAFELFGAGGVRPGGRFLRPNGAAAHQSQASQREACFYVVRHHYGRHSSSRRLFARRGRLRWLLLKLRRYQRIGSAPDDKRRNAQSMGNVGPKFAEQIGKCIQAYVNGRLLRGWSKTTPAVGIISIGDGGSRQARKPSRGVEGIAARIFADH